MKKVLIISYYWPPCGGIGVLRCLKFAKYLRDYGWEPIIYTADQADYPSYDRSNFNDTPHGIYVIRQKIWEPYKLYRFITGRKPNENVNNIFYTSNSKKGLMHKLSVWIRSNFFIPDARCLWIKPSVKRITQYLEENPVDAILSNGPPHTNTRIATLIKRKFNIPWLADFQDPWTQVDYYALLSLTKKADLLHRKMEREVLESADAITIVSNTWKDDLELIGARDVKVINWGFDPEDFEYLEKIPKPKFSIVHIGILGYDRNPESLFKVISELCEENSDFKNLIELRFAGQVDISVINSIKEYKLTPFLVLEGNLERKKALEIAYNSSVLLLPLNRQANAKGRIPGKLFEYLACRKPILCLGDIEGDSFDIVNEMKAGLTTDYNNHKIIKSFLIEKFKIFKTLGEAEELTSDINKYSIRKLTGNIAQILDSISNKL